MKPHLINAITTSRFSRIAKIHAGTSGFTGHPHYCIAFLSTCTYILRRNSADRPPECVPSCTRHKTATNLLIPPIFSDTDEPHQQTPNLAQSSPPTHQPRAPPASRPSALLQHERQVQPRWPRRARRQETAATIFRPSKYDESTKIYDLHLLKGVSSSSFYPSSPGPEPRVTPSNTHMLARIPFAWINSLLFWLCAAKSTGMTDIR